MTTEIAFSNAEILMARKNEMFILWDKNCNAFGTGETYANALQNLANNLPEKYHE